MSSTQRYRKAVTVPNNLTAKMMQKDKIKKQKKSFSSQVALLIRIMYMYVSFCDMKLGTDCAVLNLLTKRDIGEWTM